MGDGDEIGEAECEEEGGEEGERGGGGVEGADIWLESCQTQEPGTGCGSRKGTGLNA